MRLFTHNQLICVRRGCPKPFPLAVRPTKVEQEDSDLNLDFLLHIAPNIDYEVLFEAAKVLGQEGELPPPTIKQEDENQDEKALAVNPLQQANLKCSLASMIESLKGQDNKKALFLQAVHLLLLDTHIMEGSLVCGGCKREYSIQQGIPNLRLNEDEV